MRTWTFADVAAHWDSVAYDESNAKIDSYLRRFVDSAPLFSIPPGAHVLDIDCRTGNGTIFFAQRHPDARFRCMAMAPSFARIAEKKIKEAGVNAEVSAMIGLPLPAADAAFDVVLCYESLEHVPDPGAFLKEISRVTRNGGTLVLTTPNRLWEPVHWLSAKLHLDHGEGPHRMLRRREIIDHLNRAGFAIAEERTFVLVPAGPRWLLAIGRWKERWMPERIKRMLCLRRTFICRKLEIRNTKYEKVSNFELRASDFIHDPWYEKLKVDILDPALETGDGSCVGLSGGLLRYEDRNGELVVVRTEKQGELPRAAYDACPGRFCDYPALNRFVFGRLPENWLCGVVERSFVGHAADASIRRSGASGGVITAMLLHLLKTKKIAGAVCLRMGVDQPWNASPVVARTPEEILACAGSVYSATPVNTILDRLERESGPLAYVGLPDQVAAIRKLQAMRHPSVRNIAYVFGPYTGTQMSFEAIRSFLRSHGVRSEQEIADLRYRAGEWPGHLRITLRDGRTLRAEKFHYNYLIPFFVTRATFQIPDFTNELTDVSVGDAWSPTYEAKRGGHSVVLARSAKGTALLEEMRAEGKLSLEDIDLRKALDMHGHMLDFKKRGSFIRNGWKRVRPEYGYRPASIPPSRIFVEWCLRVIFAVGRNPVARWTVEHLPISMVGPLFNALRKQWKAASKPTKRKGLREMQFIVDHEGSG